MTEFEQGMSDIEGYANAFYYFILNLIILSEGPERQCEMMGYDNVAWELRHDVVLWADVVINLSDGILSKDQREEISHLKMEVAAIPEYAVDVYNVKQEHLIAMKDPIWVPIRAKAKKLISLLKSEIDRTNEILHLK